VISGEVLVTKGAVEIDVDTLAGHSKIVRPLDSSWLIIRNAGQESSSRTITIEDYSLFFPSRQIHFAPHPNHLQVDPGLRLGLQSQAATRVCLPSNEGFPYDPSRL
jgi:hypothetical protein